MRSAMLGRFIVVGAILALPVVGYAQGEAGVNGTITDSTGGVLPGATGPVQLPCAEDLVHEAHESPLSAGGHLQPGGSVG